MPGYELQSGFDFNGWLRIQWLGFNGYELQNGFGFNGWLRLQWLGFDAWLRAAKWLRLRWLAMSYKMAGFG